MIVDMQQVTLTEGVLEMPNFPYAALPKPPSQLLVTDIIAGGSATPGNSITGSADFNNS